MIGLGKKERVTWVFDCDDTVRWTSYEYSLQIARFVSYLYEHLQQHVPYITQLIPRHEEIDHDLAKKGGFGRGRFPQSFVEVYHEICRKGRIPINKQVEENIWSIGSGVFKTKEEYAKKGFVDGGKETLEFLVQHSDELYMVTRGEEEVQQAKIEGLELTKYMPRDHIFIVNSDKKPSFQAISEGKNHDTVIVVEDSLEIINQATTSLLNLRGVYIPLVNGTWKYEQSENGLVNKSRVKKFERIIEIKEKYDEIVAWCYS